MCEKTRPVFIVESDDMILRLPDKFLPPFLKDLKRDYIQKRQYLKFLRISSKIIQICKCEEKKSHAYCCTAYVMRTQKIYCKDCYSYYHLYVKSEKLFSSEYLGGLMRLLMMLFAIAGVIYGVYEIDHYLKLEYTRELINDKIEFVNNNKNKTEQIKEYELENADDYEVNSTFVFIPLLIVLIVIWIWCLYLRFVMEFMKRKRLLWVEVQDQNNSEFDISRNQAK